MIQAYLIKLIGVANTPFHPQGATQDDVSLFLVDEALAHLRGGADVAGLEGHSSRPQSTG